MKATGTNTPTKNTHKSTRTNKHNKHLLASTHQYLTHHTRPHKGAHPGGGTGEHEQGHTCGPIWMCRWLIATGKRPVPFRTRKLSPPAPMVLHPGGCGRVGYRRPNNFTSQTGKGPTHNHVCWASPHFQDVLALHAQEKDRRRTLRSRSSLLFLMSQRLSVRPYKKRPSQSPPTWCRLHR